MTAETSRADFLYGYHLVTHKCQLLYPEKDINAKQVTAWRVKEQAESMGLIHRKLSILLLWCTTIEDLHQQKKTNPTLSEQHTDVHLMSWVTSSMQVIFKLSDWDKDKFRISAWVRFHFFWRYFDMLGHFRYIIQNPSTACWLTKFMFPDTDCLDMCSVDIQIQLKA